MAAIYPGVWGVSQLGTGALSDKVGRKTMIVAGMWVQAAGILLVLLTYGFAPWALTMVLLGHGTALVYATLLAAISDVAHPDWRASAVGVYRLWRSAASHVAAFVNTCILEGAGALATVTLKRLRCGRCRRRHRLLRTFRY